MLGDIGFCTKNNSKIHGQSYIIYFAISLPYFEEENVALMRTELSSMGSHKRSSLFPVLREKRIFKMPEQKVVLLTS